jgi:hypothetical protein
MRTLLKSFGISIAVIAMLFVLVAPVADAHSNENQWSGDTCAITGQHYHDDYGHGATWQQYGWSGCTGVDVSIYYKRSGSTLTWVTAQYAAPCSICSVGAVTPDPISSLIKTVHGGRGNNYQWFHRTLTH